MLKKFFLSVLFFALPLLAVAGQFNAYAVVTASDIKFNIIPYATSYYDVVQDVYSQLIEETGGDMRFTKSIPVPGKTADELFNMMRMYAVDNFTSSQCNIFMVDKDIHTIVMQGYVADVSSSMNLTTNWIYSLTPKITLVTEDELVIATVQMESYSVLKKVETGLYFTSTTVNNEVIDVKSLYPYDPTDVFYKTHSKLFCYAIATCGLYMAALEKTLLPSDYGYGEPNDDFPVNYEVIAPKGVRAYVHSRLDVVETITLPRGTVFTAYGANHQFVTFYRGGLFHKVFICNQFTMKPLAPEKMPIALAAEQPAGRVEPLHFWEFDRRILSFGR